MEKNNYSPVVHYQDASVTLNQDASVLEALESANIRIPNSCRAGLCQSCMMRTDDPVPNDAQKGLTSSQVAQGYFLACSCYPKNDLHVELKSTNEITQAVVLDKRMANPQVLVLRLQADIRWFPGQYLTLWKDEFEGRPYSIASRCDNEKTIEVHITYHEQGVVSRWLHDDIEVGQTINISKPTGDCFYTDDHSDKPILMACTGTGLAPIYGVLLESIAQNHDAPIHIYAGAGEPNRLYYQKELKALASIHSHIHYSPVVRRQASEDMIEGDLVDELKQRFPDLKGWKVFLCGAPAMVKTVQRNCFFQGASVTDILVDAFESAAPKND